MAGRIRRLDQAHCVGDRARAPGPEEDQRRGLAVIREVAILGDIRVRHSPEEYEREGVWGFERS
jgi:hypothetical protein